MSNAVQQKHPTVQVADQPNIHPAHNAKVARKQAIALAMNIILQQGCQVQVNKKFQTTCKKMPNRFKKC